MTLYVEVRDGKIIKSRESLIKNSQYHRISFLFLTAKTDKEERFRGLSQGAVDYIWKPFEISELKEKIKNWLLLVDIKKMNEATVLEEKHNWRLDDFIQRFNITYKEKEVIGYLLQSKKNNEIAEKMFISSNTVRKHIERIKEKLNLTKKEDLINFLFDYVYK